MGDVMRSKNAPRHEGELPSLPAYLCMAGWRSSGSLRVVPIISCYKRQRTLYPFYTHPT